jgi:hypothetical protein
MKPSGVAPLRELSQCRGIDTRAGQWETSMGNVYIEARPKGRPEGSHIDDYVAEDHADSVLSTFKTQLEAV